MYGGIFFSPGRKQEYCLETSHKQITDWNAKKVTLMDTNSNSIRHQYPKYMTRAENPFLLTYLN